MQFDQFRRREFITLLGGAAAAWPLAARAQKPAKLPAIGFLGASTPAAWNQWTAAFVGRLRELGWIEGRTVAIEYRWAEGRSERFTEIAAEFVQLNVDVIVTAGVASVIAAKQATSVVPIVFALAKRPGWQRPRCKFGATGRQRHRVVDPAPILSASGSNSCVKSLPNSAGWRSWPTSASRMPCWRWARFRQRPRPRPRTRHIRSPASRGYRAGF